MSHRNSEEERKPNWIGGWREVRDQNNNRGKALRERERLGNKAKLYKDGGDGGLAVAFGLSEQEAKPISENGG